MWLGEEHVGAISTGFTSLQGVVDMLEKLHDKFEDERTDLEKEESNARHAYEMLIQDLTAQIETATEDREAKAQEKASKLQKAAEEKLSLIHI